MRAFNGEFHPLGGYKNRPFVKAIIKEIDDLRSEHEPLPKKSKSLKTIYDKLAVKYPDGVTIDVAESLQDDYPLEFGRLKPRSIQKGVKRAIDRKKREDAGF